MDTAGKMQRASTGFPETENTDGKPQRAKHCCEALREIPLADFERGGRKNWLRVSKVQNLD